MNTLTTMHIPDTTPYECGRHIHRPAGERFPRYTGTIKRCAYCDEVAVFCENRVPADRYRWW